VGLTAGIFFFDQLIIGQPAAESAGQDFFHDLEKLRADDGHPPACQLGEAADLA